MEAIGLGLPLLYFPLKELAHPHKVLNVCGLSFLVTRAPYHKAAPTNRGLRGVKREALMSFDTRARQELPAELMLRQKSLIRLFGDASFHGQ